MPTTVVSEAPAHTVPRSPLAPSAVAAVAASVVTDGRGAALDALVGCAPGLSAGADLHRMRDEWTR